MDLADGQVHVLGAQYVQLTAPEPRVQRRSPKRPIAALECAQQRVGPDWRDDLELAAPFAGQREPPGGVMPDRAEPLGTPVDPPERRDGQPDRGRGEAVSDEPVDVTLEGRQVEVGQPVTAELGQRPQP